MKRLILTLLFILAVPWLSHAQTYIRPGNLTASWRCTLVGLAATLTQCQAVPVVSSQRHYITDIIVGTTTTTPGTYSVQYGTGTNCATGTTALFPSTGTGDRFDAPAIAQGMNSFHFITPLQPAAGAAICVIGEATDTIDIVIHGFLAR